MGLVTCPDCGNAVSDAAPSCPQCGRPGQVSTPLPLPVAAPQSIGQDPVMRMILPVGRSGWAIAAGYLGLFAVTLLPAPLALLFGIIAIVDIRRHPDRHGMGRAIFGIVMGLIFTAFLVMIIWLRLG
jgi:Domain of unknown function (DUF4190)